VTCLTCLRWPNGVSVLCSTLFRQITRESHVLHYLLPAKRDAEVTGHLRSTKKYPTVRARTSQYKNSFIPYALFNFQWHLIPLRWHWQWHFHACMFVYFHCMNVCLVVIQPLGCQNPIHVNVMLHYTDMLFALPQDRIGKGGSKFSLFSIVWQVAAVQTVRCVYP